MKIRTRRKVGLAILAFFALSALVMAQTTQEPKQVIKHEVRVVGGQSGVGSGTGVGVGIGGGVASAFKVVGDGTAGWVVNGDGQNGTFTFVSSEMGFESKVMKGSPFTADTVTEFMQTLGNGQKIYRKSTALLARDSEGRTRREQTIDKIGPFTTADHAHLTIFINDPVAGVSYTLEPESKTALKTTIIIGEVGASVNGGAITFVAPAGVPPAGVPPAGAQPRRTLATTGAVSEEKKVIIMDSTRTAGGGAAVYTTTAGVGGVLTTTKILSPNNVRTESLGTQSFDGVAAEGTRTIETIPAGAIGNDTPIEIVSEKWYSQELGMVIKTVRSDPMAGENVYQLTNIRRAEPAPSLFQLPSDYTVKEANVHIQTIKKEIK